MRLLELYLKAFGSFTEGRIELPDAGGPGLCVFHGANEAGKSTALRAIRGLIYGIPARSPDDFIHRYPDLRIGARMRFDDGEELSVMRRKRAKASLYDYADSAVLESDRMDRLVEAVPELLFERFYGLDHLSLREGSAALLRDDGEVGPRSSEQASGLPTSEEYSTASRTRRGNSLRRGRIPGASIWQSPNGSRHRRRSNPSRSIPGIGRHRSVSFERAVSSSNR